MFTGSIKRDQQHEMGYVDHGTLFYRMTGIIDISFFVAPSTHATQRIITLKRCMIITLKACY